MEEKTTEEKSAPRPIQKVSATPPTSAKKPEPKVEVKTEAHKIWSDIKDKPIEMFALPNQVVSQYCKPYFIETNRLYVIPTAAAVLPALEAALGSKYAIEVVDKYFAIGHSKK